MANKVLDSWALIAFFEDEPAADAAEARAQDIANPRLSSGTPSAGSNFRLAAASKPGQVVSPDDDSRTR